jgi:hypothetical protein
MRRPPRFGQARRALGTGGKTVHSLVSGESDDHHHVRWDARASA